MVGNGIKGMCINISKNPPRIYFLNSNSPSSEKSKINIVPE